MEGFQRQDFETDHVELVAFTAPTPAPAYGFPEWPIIEPAPGELPLHPYWPAWRGREYAPRECFYWSEPDRSGTCWTQRLFTPHERLRYVVVAHYPSAKHAGPELVPVGSAVLASDCWGACRFQFCASLEEADAAAANYPDAVAIETLPLKCKVDRIEIA